LLLPRARIPFSGEETMSNQNVHLHRFITQRYNLDELETLCFSMGLEYQDLPGWTRGARVREFIIQVGEQGDFDKLLGRLKKDRPIPFNQAGLSTDSALVQRLRDDLDDYKELSKPFYQKWQQQLQLDVRRVLVLLVLVFLSLLGGTGFLFITLREVRPAKMTGEFNIAIAEFGEVDENGRIRASEAGEILSATIFNRIKKEMQNLPSGLTVQVWHNEVNPGVQLSYLPGDTGEERAGAAMALAKKINADLVIYGNLRQHDQGSRFLPEFYVAELKDAGELLGAHTLGTEIPIRGSIDSLGGTIRFNEEFSARANALTLFTIGLALEAAGYPDRALEKFRQAEAIEGWDDDEGKEILYLFIGREANFLWLEGEDRGDEVRAAMQKALAINPAYGRAYIGLGNYHIRLSEEQFAQIQALRRQEEAINSEAMLRASSRFNQETNQAVRYYREALENLPAAGRDLVETKVHLALGGTHIRQADLLYLTGEHDTAITLLNLAKAEYEEAYDNAEDDDYRHLALAQLGIARANHQKGNIKKNSPNPDESHSFYRKALDSYNTCIALAQEDEFDWFLQDFRQENCETGRRDVSIELAGLALLQGE
jgi:hypothetical protein